jgi:hypothetical protein
MQRGFDKLAYGIRRFRWVYCQLETLRRRVPTVIRRALDELPETLDGTYERALLAIEKEKREFAHRIFQCITVSVRPLRVDELASILAIRFDAGQLPQYDMDWRSEDAQEAVLSVCSSLIMVVNVEGSPIVQFSHFSAKEFLTSDRLANAAGHLSRFHVLPRLAHTILAQASLSVLLHLGGRVDKNSIGNFPFACYAAQYWVDHARFEDVSSSIQDAMEQLFDEEGPSFATWIWIHDVDYPFRPHMLDAHPPEPEAAPLYYAALCGFRGLVEHLIAIHPEAINFKGGNHGSAVNSALMKGHVEIAMLLLEHGADVNTMDSRGLPPLHRAIERDRCHHFELLLEYHADIHLRDTFGATPLCQAATCGVLEFTQELLRRGATVDALDHKGWTPLKAASRFGHLDVARCLVESGAGVDIPSDEGRTPLQSAS